MMSTSGQNYKELAIPHFEKVFQHIDEVMQEFGVPYYLIGANAIALELLKKGIKPSRGTKDIDFAIMLSTMKEYENISAELVERGFRKAKAPWTYFFEKENVVIDLLPYGEIQENDTEDFNKRNAYLHIIGFQEVLEEATTVQVEEKSINIPPLPGMVLLKLVAWADRPEERENDLSDILKIINHFYELEFDRIVENHYDLMDTEDFDETTIAAESLGREAGVYLKKSDALEERINSILRDDLKKVQLSNIAKEWARQSGEEVEYAFKLLNSFQRGILTSLGKV